jgi:hypothetical protein
MDANGRDPFCFKECDLLAHTSQQDGIDSNCLTYFFVATARHAITSSAIYNVIDISQLWNPDISLNKIQTISKRKEELLPETITLINRLENEFGKYFPKPDTDQIMMMVFHPIMVWNGFE